MFMTRFAGLLLALVSVSTAAGTPPELRDPEKTYDAFVADVSAKYAALQAAYAAALAAAPNDIELAVARCQFIENFTYAEDIHWNAEAERDLETCTTALDERWPDAPEVLVYGIESNYDDDALDDAKALWGTAQAWSKPLRARMASRLHDLHEGAGNKYAAGRFAAIAVRLGADDALPAALKYLVDRGDADKAIAMAETAQPATYPWNAAQRIAALGGLVDKSAALNEMKRAQSAGLEIPPATQLRVYLDIGDLESAQGVSDQLEGESAGTDLRKALFQLAMARGKPSEAADLISFEIDEMDVAIQRYTDVVHAAPSLALSGNLLPVTLVVLVVLLMLMLVPGLLLVPVHYRGLMRRQNGRAPTPLFDRIGLRHAWIGLVIALLAPLLAIWIFHPALIGLIFSEAEGSGPFNRFDVNVLAAMATLILLAPWLRNFGWQHLLGRRGNFGRTLLIVFACALATFAVGVVMAQLLQSVGAGTAPTEHTRTVADLVRGSLVEHGLLVTLLLIAVAVPLLEELVYRGLLLGGLSRHLSFGWANAIQALLFAGLHADAPRFLYYFMLGWLAGWLVRRERSLWPAIALHVLNNAIAVLLASAFMR